METPLNTTFGIEFEFIVRYNNSDYEAGLIAGEGVYWSANILTRYQKLQTLVQARMIKVLTKHGIPTNQWNEEGFTKWTVEKDGTVSASDRNEKNWCAIELKTPAYFFHPWALAKIEKVIDLVNKNFDSHTNESCGLHIHVGNMHHGFPLRTIKNLAMLITIFERQLNSLHPFHRLLNSYVKPLSACVFRHDTEPWEKLLMIQRCDHVEDIISRFNPNQDQWTAYSFVTLLYENLHTIEFRQHAGSLDTQAVLNWARLTVGLINASHEAGAKGFLDLFFDHVNGENYTVIDLLHHLDLDDVAEYYSAKGEERIYHHPAFGSAEWTAALPPEEPRAPEYATGNKNSCQSAPPALPTGEGTSWNSADLGSGAAASSQW